MKGGFLVIVFTLLMGKLFAQEVSSSLSNEQIRIGEQTTLVWELRCPAGTQSIQLPAFGDTISKFIDVIDLSEVDTTFDEENIEIKVFTQKITLTSWDSGFHAIPPLAFILNNQEYRTTPLLLQVESVPLNAEQDIKDIKTIIDEPFSLWEWLKANVWSVVLTFLLLLLLSIGLYYYLQYLKKPKEEKPAFIPKASADQVALKQLEALQSKKLWESGKVKEFHVELSHILREYVENRYQFRALELTRQEILALLSRVNNINRSLVEELDQYLLLSDLAKFAKVLPNAEENTQSTKFAFRFIEETKFEEIAEEKEKIEESMLEESSNQKTASNG